ncbi:MAG: orotidine-5'-phosphate decarboxylase [Candidatus Diapherotrites archaeon]|nr:orotidine-5'-phosphate decarboxylase [Candidatus Diapherotrites archaeon]
MAQKNFIDFLKKSAEEKKSIVCMGFDPVIEKIPVKGKSIEYRIVEFYSEIIEACKYKGCLPAAFKPNYAFYAQYGFEGLRALKKVILACKKTNVPVILDVKRADIGKTSMAYAKEIFEFFEADACTILPYFGIDSVQPFLEYCKKGYGVYALNRSSNESAKEFQNLICNGVPFYIKTAEKILEWSKSSSKNLGAIVGATSLNELRNIVSIYKNSYEVPLLIPGVGAQGGSASEVTATLKEVKYDLRLVRINASASLNYAYEKYGTDDFAGAAVKALKEMNKEIGFG